METLADLGVMVWFLFPRSDLKLCVLQEHRGRVRKVAASFTKALVPPVTRAKSCSLVHIQGHLLSTTFLGYIPTQDVVGTHSTTVGITFQALSFLPRLSLPPKDILYSIVKCIFKHLQSNVLIQIFFPSFIRGKENFKKPTTTKANQGIYTSK